MSAPVAESWRLRWLNWRNRRLMDPSFHRWARRLPLFRQVTQRRARGFFDLCAGFIYSQVLYACVRLNLFERLRDGPASLELLAEATEIPSERLLTLLLSARALGLLERCDEQWLLGQHGAAMLAEPGIAAMVRHHALLYADLADPLPLLRNAVGPGQLARYWAYAGGETTEGAATAAYSDLMASSQSLLSEDILDACDLSARRQLLDIGGGHGAFAIAAARRHPLLSVTVFDLPSVVERARAAVSERPEAARIALQGGDVYTDPLPEVDAVSLVRILHDHDDPQAMEFLRAARRALKPGGILLIAEPMAEPKRGDPASDTYFGMYLMAMGQGRPRTPGELTRMAQAAGFGRCSMRHTAVPMLVRVLVAEAS